MAWARPSPLRRLWSHYFRVLSRIAYHQAALLVTLSGLITGLPDGPTSGYCKVLMPNVDAYGREISELRKVIGPIIKSHTIITGDRVGIGTGMPGSTLDVNGGVRAKGGEPGEDNSFLFGGDGHGVTGMNSLGDGSLDFYASGLKAVNIESTDFNLLTATILGDLKVMQGEHSYSGGNLTIDHKLTTTDLTVQVITVDTLYASKLLATQLTTSGAATIGGDIKSQGRIQDVSGDVMPVGTVVSFIGQDIPIGWLICEGQGIPYYTPEFIKMYGALYQVLGQPPFFKDGNNNDYFHAPDLRSRFIVGAVSYTHLTLPTSDLV